MWGQPLDLGFVFTGKGVTVAMRTYVAKGAEAEALKVGAQWFVVDATNVVLGRLATRVARLLIGKDKASFTPYLDSGDHVVVINADKIRMTGNKVEQKVYYSHSGYPGGLKEVPAKRVREAKPEWMIREAVLGMLPKNKLRARRAKKLRVYRDATGLARHAGQKPQSVTV
jgi:large subunit ribosomal protein L13